jgi:glucose-1-phosphate thymidylyltransferase
MGLEDGRERGGHAPEPVGVIPGGGGASRLAPLPFSKELYPVGFRETPAGPRPKAIVNYLIDALQLGGARRAFWLLDKRKADVFGYFGGGAGFGLQLGYVPTEASPSVVHTLVSGSAFFEGQPVLFGFPDIIFEPADAFARLWQRLQRGGADVVLGAAPAPPEQIADRVELDASGALRAVRVKPLDRPQDPAWFIAAWQPAFTDFLRTWLERDPRVAEGSSPSELYLGHAVEAARRGGMSVDVETFQDGCFIDAGTPEGLRLALARHGAAGGVTAAGARAPLGAPLAIGPPDRNDRGQSDG